MKLSFFYFLIGFITFTSGINVYGVSEDPQHQFKGTLWIDQDNPQDQVLQAEKARFAAMVVKNYKVLDRLISSDLHYIHSNGNIDTKESFIAALKNGTRNYDDITMKDVQVRVYGEVGIINAKCIYHRQDEAGNPNNLQLLYTSVYALQEGRWQHVSWQSFRM